MCPAACGTFQNIFIFVALLTQGLTCAKHITYSTTELYPQPAFLFCMYTNKYLLLYVHAGRSVRKALVLQLGFTQQCELVIFCVTAASAFL